MADSCKVIGIELPLLEELLRSIIHQEMVEVREEIKQTLISKRESLLQEERLYTEDVAKILDVTRHTVLNYRRRGDLPEPQFDVSNRPYWTPEQLERLMRLKGIKTHFPV